MQEVHVLFDDPGLSPKDIEHHRRDKQSSGNEPDTCMHQHFTIEETERPPKWRELLQCRTCKRKLTEFLSEEMVHQVSGTLTANC